MKDVAALVKLFKQHGFTLARSKNHQIFNCPCGHARVTVPASPGGGNRSITNSRALMQRTLRACKFEEETK